MRLREPLLLGVLAFAVVMLVSTLDDPWQESLAWGFAVAFGYVIHQGSGS